MIWKLFVDRKKEEEKMQHNMETQIKHEVEDWER